MNNFILKYTGQGQADAGKMCTTLMQHHGQLLDGSLLPNSALVGLEEGNLEAFKKQLDPEWMVYPEKSYPIPR